MADQPRRVNYVDGLLLTAADLAAEQEYQRSMRYFHNRLHGVGVACGLEVTTSRGWVQVGPGLAIDAQGRELVVTAPLRRRLELPPAGRRWVRDLIIVWREVAERPMGIPGGEVVPTRWVEQPALVLSAAGRGPADGVVLARLRRASRGAVQVDTSARGRLAVGCVAEAGR